jgi:excisionase family DNA binding protein
MDGKRILLARLSHGAIGEENAHLLGSLLVAKIAQAATSRQDEDAAKRVPFFLYIDEFHHFVTPSISSILSGARKYGLGLVLAHQEMRQLKSRSDEVMSAVLGNAYTRIAFRLGDQDSRVLADGLSFFEASDLQNLGIGEAIARVERPDFDFNLRTFPVPSVTERVADARRREVADASRARYGTPRAEVEASLHAVRQEREATTYIVPTVAPTPQNPVAPMSDRVAQPAPIKTRLPGRGGPVHKYIQDLIRKVAEDRGFEVSIEQTVLDGHGYVDVTLVRDELRIACEISITTRVPHEVRNLAKCITAGFTYAVLISEDERALAAAAAEFTPPDERIRFLTPDNFITFLEEVPGGTRVRRVSKVKGNQGKIPFEKPATPEDTKRLLGTEAAAEYLGLAVQTLAKMRVSGESPPFYKLGRQVLYYRTELDDWVAARKRRSTSDSGRE